MAERRKIRVLTAVWSNRRRSHRRPGQWPDTTDALAALGRAWTTTVFASALFVAALAVAQVWDGAVFRQALHDALSQDPQLAQPTDDFPLASLTGDENPLTK
jgi:hypothetical protein